MEKKKKNLILLTIFYIYSCLFGKIIFANLFYYLTYFCYYSWISLHFLVLPFEIRLFCWKYCR